jgi:3-isopropylmalate/(R)-2-methylmalate dehydratase small subunit
MVKTGDQLEVNLQTGLVKNLTTRKEIQGKPLSGLESEITQKGGLLNYLKANK